MLCHVYIVIICDSLSRYYDMSVDIYIYIYIYICYQLFNVEIKIFNSVKYLK